MLRSLRRALVSTAMVSLASCAGSGSAPTPNTSLMLRHFDHARTLNRAAIFGRLDEGTDAARRIGAEGPPPSMPAGSEPFYRAFEGSVTRAAAAAGREALARDAASIALRCGDCHLASGLGPSFSVDSPNEAATLRDHMRVHAWASDRMWEGLVGGSDLAWRAGARALSGQTLRESLYVDRVSDARAASGYITDVHDLGVRALATNDREERARLLGDLWATCSGCHALAGVR